MQNYRMRTLTSIILLIFISGQSRAQNDSALYSFFIAGHASGKPGVDNEGLHPAFIKQYPYIKSRKEIELGFLTGDVIRAFPGPTVQDWVEVDEDIDSLHIPVYITVGNHDMEDRPIFEQRYGKTYYSFTEHNDLFIVLDPNIDGWKITGDQLQFLKDTLNHYENQVDNIFMFFHQVIWREVNNGFDHIIWNSNEGKNGKTNFWPELYPILSNLNHPVFLFAGDVGAASYASPVSYDIYNNLTLITSGMGNVDNENYVVINVDSSKGITYDLICLKENEPDCLGKLKDRLIVNSPLNDTNPDLQNTVNIYPNPVENTLNFNLRATGNYSIEVYNINGQLLIKDQITDLNYGSVSTENLLSGVYFLSVKSDTSTELVKFIRK